MKLSGLCSGLLNGGAAFFVTAATLFGYGGLDSRSRAVAWPKARPSADAAVKVDGAQFLATEQLKKWQVDLDQRGLRATGSAAREQYVDALYKRLATAGVKQLYFEPAKLTRWSVDNWGLEIVNGSQPGQVTTASYIPYSGVTTTAGLTAPMAYLTAGTAPSSGLAGKIVVFDVATLAITSAQVSATAISRYDPNNEFQPNAPYVRPYIYLGAVHRMEKALEAVGAAGLIAVTDRPNTYIPYDCELHKVPGLFVDRTVGANLKALAAENVSLKLKRPAKVETIETRNLIGIIPGASNELTVINSHTDGTNGIEDNGPNAIVDIAQDLTRLPKHSLPRSIMIMLSSRHFAGGVGIESFLARHANDGLLDRIASVVTIEHLGAKEYLPDASGKLVPTGNFEGAGLYMPKVPALITAAQAMKKNADAAPSSVSLPTNPRGDGTTNYSVWPGEGQYFWGKGKIPTINYITGPYYLLDWGLRVTTWDKVDYDRMHRVTVTFTQMLLDLSRVPLADLWAEQQ